MVKIFALNQGLIKLYPCDKIQEKAKHVDVFPIVKAKKDLQLGRLNHLPHKTKQKTSHKSSFCRGIVAIAADDSGIRLNPRKKDVFRR